MITRPGPHGEPAAAAPTPHDADPATGAAGSRRANVLAMILVVAAAIVLWLPRYAGPIDMRWDGAVYYILGTSLAEGRGYKLLNEPGAIDAVQYPPLLPAIVAAHQRLLGTSNPTTVGRWLRLTSFAIFIAYAVVVLRFFRTWLRVRYAVLGAWLSIMCLYAWFLSDLLFPEIWFAVATLLFLMSVRRHDSTIHSALAYVWALAAYALRTIGLAGFAVWVLDSVIRRRFRQAALRAVLALIPFVSWQTYIASVERSYQYNHPAYEYQRAPFLFYNVSYARNIALRDPLTPEKGEVRIARRVVRNALSLPVCVGETLSAWRAYFDVWRGRLVGNGPATDRVGRWTIVTLLSVFGGVLVAGGIAVQFLAGQPLAPLYILVYLAALCLTPFPDQYLRYLMPIAPLLALSAIVFLLRVGPGSQRRVEAGIVRRNLPFVVLGPALLIQVMSAAEVYAREYRNVQYIDQSGKPVAYRLFFYGDKEREFDQAVDYLRAHAQEGDVVAAGTPHWIYLRTGLKAVMPPFDADAARAHALLDTVPVRYLVVGRDVIGSERYSVPVVQQFSDRWRRVYSTPAGYWAVYRRVE